MCNHTAVAKTSIKAASTLAIALLTMGMGVNCSWAGSGQPSDLKSTPVTSNTFSQPGTAAGSRHRWFAQYGLPWGAPCTATFPQECYSGICQWSDQHHRLACLCYGYRAPCAHDYNCCSWQCSQQPGDTQKLCHKSDSDY